MSEESKRTKFPLGFKLRHTLPGHIGTIYCIAWSPDGRTLASVRGKDGNVSLWDASTGQLLRNLERHSDRISSVAWSPDGSMLAFAGPGGTVELWDVVTGELEPTAYWPFEQVITVEWSPDASMLAVAGSNGSVSLWDTVARRLRNRLTEGSNRIGTMAWSPDGRTLATPVGSSVWLWNFSGSYSKGHRTLEGHSDLVLRVAWTSDGKTLASASSDGTVRLWETATGKVAIILEGHTDSVNSISFSFDDSLLASKSLDGTVRLWRCDTGENVAVLEESASGRYPPNLTFHPAVPALATLGKQDTVIRIWDLDFDFLLSGSQGSGSVSYTNAKVVLVGDTGVGKTGLGVRLAERVWRPPTGSTHGMNVWPLYSEPEREVMLWDFAGQDEYRLVHQLFLNETNVALLLYDPTKSQDTFFGVDYWEKALTNAMSNGVQKLLVAARVDVGNVRMTSEYIESHCKKHSFLAHFATSAETNEGCDELRTAILEAIPWGRLPKTSSPEIFKSIKNFLTSFRQGNHILARQADLLEQFNSQAGSDGTPTADEFRTVIGHVETIGLIKRLSFGDLVLLKPELLNRYAGSIIDAARQHHRGLGAVLKADVLEGRIKLKESEEQGLNRADKIFMLHATVELFLSLGLALEQDGNLVFPSKFNQQMPPLEEYPVIEVEFAFEGPVENLYTTLVVKLYYGGIFRLEKLWKNAAEFLNAHDRVCGFQLHTEGDGHGILKIFYAEGVSDDDKALFLKIVADHFKEKSVEVMRHRIYRCSRCGEVVSDQSFLVRATEKNRNKIYCQHCGETIPLVDKLEVLYRDDKKFLGQIAEMENRAEAGMEREGDLVAAAAELLTNDFKTWAGGAAIATKAIVFTDVVDSSFLNVKFGDGPWGPLRDAHFELAEKLVKIHGGYSIKTLGDGVMAAFHSANDALDFAIALHCHPGAEPVRIRVGIHIGLVEVKPHDAFGQHVNMAARVLGKATDGGIWVSAQVKEDIRVLNASKHSHLMWTKHPDEEVKGFPEKYTLWSVEYER
jgi:small GTP-binding protein